MKVYAIIYYVEEGEAGITAIFKNKADAQKRFKLIVEQTFEGDDDVDIDRGAGFAGEGAGDRASDGVRNAQGVQLAYNQKRRLDRIDGRRHREITAAASG